MHASKRVCVAEDVILVGGGIVSAAAAFYLRERGVAACVVERCAVACHSSGKAGGFLARTWCDGGVSKQLTRESYGLHLDLWKQSAGKGVELGYRHLEAVEASPSSSDQTVVGDASDCAQVNPRLLTQFLMQEAAPTLMIADVVRVTRCGAGTVESLVLGDGTELDCAGKKVVFCLGAWSGLLSQWFPEAAFPAKAWDGGHNHVVLSAGDAAIPQKAVFSACGGVEIYPRPDGSVYICCEASEPLKTLPASADAMAPSAADIDAALKKAAAIYPTLAQPSIERTGSGLCCLPTFGRYHPTIGAVPGCANAYLACGHSCWGILQAPATGKALASLVLGTEGQSASSTDVSAYAPTFHL